MTWIYDINHAHVYLKSHDDISLMLVENLRSVVAGTSYPPARISFEPPPMFLTRIFESQQPPLVAKITTVRGQRVPEVEQR
jgi:hypothetical protein